jgi:hypothetical protein
MFPVKKRPNAVPIDKEMEANFLEMVLKDRDIPYVFVSYHDTAYDGIFQLQHGWGHVEVPMEYVEEVQQLYEEVKHSRPVMDEEPGKGGSGEPPEEH